MQRWICSFHMTHHMTWPTSRAYGRQRLVLLPKMHLRLITLLSFLAYASRGVLATCGYEACPSTVPGMLNVHLVPHTHDDVGWLKTVDQYYYGAKNKIQNAAVQYILDTVTRELANDPVKRFSYVETAFFERWWNEQTDKTKALVKQLVNEGRLEFVNGGWCMNDEATTHYNAIIDQMTIGLKFLKDNFGDCGKPLTAWQIDPFGHSREYASLAAQMGFDSLYFARLDYLDKRERASTQTMERVWHTSPSLGRASDLFFGALFFHYGPPPGFCFDVFCSDPPIMDDPDLVDYNVDDRVSKFVLLAKVQNSVYGTNHIMFTMGSDFQYSDAHTWYKNLDKLIKYVNLKQNETNVHAFYSTPSCYTHSLNQVTKTWSTKSDDFFPYADQPHAFWTGYFTSRPALKGYVRDTNNFLQVCKQLEVWGSMLPGLKLKTSSSTLRKSMGVAQHHDAVSGTEKQHVADDYAERLYKGRAQCQELVGDVLGNLMQKNATVKPPQAVFCDYLNISVCPVTVDNQQFTITAYNPIARQVTTVVRIPVKGNYSITGPNGKMVTTQLQDVSEGTKQARRNRGNAPKELLFPITLPPLGFSTYIANSLPGAGSPPSNVQYKVFTPKADETVENQFLSLTFDGSTGLLKSMTDKKSGRSMSVRQSFYWYTSSVGTEQDSQKSGAYIFRPAKQTPQDLFNGTSVGLKVVKGPVAVEVRQQFQPWLSQVIRLYNAKEFAEFEWTVGPIPIRDHLGKEIITRFDTDLKTNRTFYTDANGRQILERIRDHRADWQYSNTEPVSGNYYPINSRAFIKDPKMQLTVMTDRSQGGSSVQDGSLEIMIHRRTLADDNRGVGEPLNETGQFGDGLIIRGKHCVLLTSVNKAAVAHRILGEQLYMAPSLSFTKGVQDWATKFNTMESMVSRALPSNIHLLTLERWTDSSILIRAENQFAVAEDPVLSQKVKFELKGLFEPFGITSLKEMTLAANEALADEKRLQWNITDSPYPTPPPIKPVPVPPSTLSVSLDPMEIRTFIATVKRTNE
ncbi:lysosomal alpha-mannosidase-like [Acanthaster planci]|uniref:Alpha-mannosidase n=1 Tax=Acanthaster planci TaxID=133434 RepID=A0A8B7XXM9_ACAPL|nr:lysosomal alpha-mannosidase-like [Acanthaster planci]